LQLGRAARFSDFHNLFFIELTFQLQEKLTLQPYPLKFLDYVSPKTLKNYPHGERKRAMQKKLFFRTSTIGYDLILVWEYVDFFLEFFTA
jgi:hypothetical protein